MTTAVEIIAAFDKAIVDLWGAALARAWPHPKDKMIADRWLATGATLPMCERAFVETLEKRHSRKLTIPFSLSYFENMIRDAITTNAEAVPDDPDTLRWRARVMGWRRNAALWREEMWGPAPDQPGCRVPRRAIAAS